MSELSTKDVAKLMAIATSTLEAWISEGRIQPKVVRVGKKNYRLWTEVEIEKVRRVKETTYRKGRGRKKKQ